MLPHLVAILSSSNGLAKGPAAGAIAFLRFKGPWSSNELGERLELRGRQIRLQSRAGRGFSVPIARG